MDHAGGLPGGMERLRAPGAEYDLLIADRMLPSGDGLALCQAARAPGTAAPPVLLLTAEDSVADKVEGLRGGAEDYLAKPFAFNELLARIGVLLRRAAAQRANGAADPRSPDAVQRVGDLALDPASRRVWRGAREVELTAKEFALLAFLMRNAGRAISRTRLLANVWEYSFDPGTKVVDVYIRYLRRKIDEGEARPLIHTVRRFGYRLSEEAPAGADTPNR